MSRFQAAFYHLLISLFAVSLLVSLVAFLWYPDFFYTIDGGWEGLRINIAVSLIAGPLLTLILFKSGKPGLKFDLIAIGILQTGCMIGGGFIMYSERPLFFIYYDKHFYSANADTFAAYNQPVPDPKEYGAFVPAMVIAALPEDPIEEADMHRLLYEDEIPVWIYSPSFKPLSDQIDSIINLRQGTTALTASEVDNELSAWLAEHGGIKDDYAFFPVHSRFGSQLVAIRREDKSFVDVMEVQKTLSNKVEAKLPD